LQSVDVEEEDLFNWLRIVMFENESKEVPSMYQVDIIEAK
jgi:hypothetical protein